jgi:hypothetical protein
MRTCNDPRMLSPSVGFLPLRRFGAQFRLLKGRSEAEAARHPEDFRTRDYQLTWRLCLRGVSGSVPGTTSRQYASLS